jgi:Family of unknown function (DUF6055)
MQPDTHPGRSNRSHFEIHYKSRNPRQGRGRGPDGVRGLELIEVYRQGLEMLEGTLTSPPWSRPAPEWTTEVRVLDLATHYPWSGGAPFTTENEQGRPIIILPSRTSEPTREAEKQWALATAVHEATHVFNCWIRPSSSLYSAKWEWFDEALAMFMEKMLIPNYHDHFRYLGNWIERPELSLDAPETSYQAVQFVAYLAKRLGTRFINRVWMEAEERESPFEAMARLLPKEQQLVSAAPGVRDLFASGYCLDSWFLNDPASPAYNQDLYERFGERAVTESFVLRPSQHVKTSGKYEERDALNRLACRYYRFYLEEEATQLHVTLHILDESEKPSLKAELAEVTKEGCQGTIVPLTPSSNLSSGRSIFSASVTPSDSNRFDCFLLVVTNCQTEFRPIHFDRKLRFVIEASAKR